MNGIRQILKNQILFYFFLLLSVVNVFVLLWKKDLIAVFTLLFSGLVTFCFSNNMTVVLCISLVVSNMFSSVEDVVFVTSANKEGLCTDGGKAAKATAAFDQWSKDRDIKLREKTRAMIDQREKDDFKTMADYAKKKTEMKNAFLEQLKNTEKANAAYAEWEKDQDAKFEKAKRELNVKRDEDDKQSRYEDTQYRVKIKKDMEDEICGSGTVNYDGPMFKQDPSFGQEIAAEQKRIADEAAAALRKAKEEAERVAREAAEKAEKVAREAAEKAEKVAREAAEKTQRAAREAADRARDAGNKAKDTARDAGNSFRRAFRF